MTQLDLNLKMCNKMRRGWEAGEYGSTEASYEARISIPGWNGDGLHGAVALGKRRKEGDKREGRDRGSLSKPMQ